MTGQMISFVAPSFACTHFPISIRRVGHIHRNGSCLPTCIHTFFDGPYHGPAPSPLAPAIVAANSAKFHLRSYLLAGRAAVRRECGGRAFAQETEAERKYAPNRAPIQRSQNQFIQMTSNIRLISLSLLSVNANKINWIERRPHTRTHFRQKYPIRFPARSGHMGS